MSKPNNNKLNWYWGKDCDICDIPWYKEKLEKELISCEDWEVKKKQKLQTELINLKEFKELNGNKDKCSYVGEEGGIHDYIAIGYNDFWINSQACENCGKTINKKNNDKWGDEWIDTNHFCQKKDNNNQAERERERDDFVLLQIPQYQIYHFKGSRISNWI